MNGYTGEVLTVDLSTGEIASQPLNEPYARQYLGGSGLACRYLYDLIDRSTIPLGPDNPLVFMNGLLTGSGAPAAARWVVAARSPLTGIYGESNCGGFFGAELRLAGYDGLIVKGRSASPVYLYIGTDQLEIRAADHLWGKDTHSTRKILESECPGKPTRSICIGQAGERLVPYGAIISHERAAAGRTGMGAVMGSKNLKAIAVHGGSRWPLANATKFRSASRQSLKGLRDALISQVFRDFGTASNVDSGIAFGSLPSRYYTQGDFPQATVLSGVTMAETILTGSKGCFGCPIRCKRVVSVREGSHALPEGEGPEYEAVAAWGSMLLVDDLAAVSYLNRLCNLYGLDTISAGVSVSFAYYLYDQRVITAADTGGLALHWGDAEAAIALLHQIGRKQGFGAILAEGVRAMGERYDRSGDAAHVKGLEVPMHDPRAFTAMGLIYATSPRGACHNRGDYHTVEIGMGNPDLELVPGDQFGSDKAQPVVTAQNWRAFTDSLGLCHFAIIPLQEVLDMTEAASGFHLNADDVLLTGERIFQLQRVLSCRLGSSAGEDRLPDILLRPLSDGAAKGRVPDMESMLGEYYTLRDWDAVSGKPSLERLTSLGMEDIATDTR
ncbi:MAG: aldehyde ferredoxin oxidoreductase family protein [Spirochaetaceae bacterium]|nr:MAG: aldehyde ferredoxin oxidoreductase family protein [Spirochaetaceae bacterium]